MRRMGFGLLLGLPLPAMALDVEAISRGLVEAGPWGKNADILPMLLGWLGVVVLVAVFAKLVYSGYDAWRTGYRARKAARQQTYEWILEMGALLGVHAPRDLQPGVASAGWHQYRHKVKRALQDELQRSRQLAAELAELTEKKRA